MKFLVLIVLLFVSQSEASNNKKYKPIPARAPNMSAAQMLNWKQFQFLPIEKKMQYIDEIRKFLVKEENKWPGQRTASFSLFSEAEAEDPTCTDLDSANLSKGQKDLLSQHPNYCIKGGFLVCVTPIKNSDHFLCSSGDKSYIELSTKKYGCAVGSSACMPPAFMMATGKYMCVNKAQINIVKSVSQACLDEQKIQDKLIAGPKNDKTKLDEFYKKLLADPSYADDYSKMKANIANYCTAKKGSLWKTDRDDCKHLSDHLLAIAPLETGLKPLEITSGGAKVDAHMTCSGKYRFKDTADGSDQSLNVKMAMTGDAENPLFTIQAPDQKEWTVTTCDSYGRVTHLVDQKVVPDATAQKYNFGTCLARAVGDEYESVHFEGNSITPTASGSESLDVEDNCNLHFARYKYASEKKNDECYLSNFDNLSFEVKDDNTGKFSTFPFKEATASALIPVTDDGPTHFQQLQQNNVNEREDGAKAGHPIADPETYRDVFYSKEKGECWGRAAVVVKADKKEDPVGPPPAAGASQQSGASTGK